MKINWKKYLTKLKSIGFKKKEPPASIDEDQELELNSDAETVPPLMAMQDEDKTAEISIPDELKDFKADEAETLSLEEESDAEEFDLTVMPLEENLKFKEKCLRAFNKTKDSLKNINVKNLKQIDFSKIKSKLQSIDTTKAFALIDKYLPKSQKDNAHKAMGNLKKINWADLHNQLLASSKRTKIHQSFLLTLLILFIALLGKTSGLLLKGKKDSLALTSKPISIDTSKSITVAQINAIKASQVFKTDAAAVSDKPRKVIIAENIKCKTSTRKSGLPIQLVNTIVLQDSVKSIAAVQIRSKTDLTEVREGDKIENMAKVDHINRLDIIVKNLKNGNCETISNNSDWSKKENPISVLTPTESKKYVTKTKIAGIDNDGNNFVIDKNFMQEKLKDFNTILTQARGIPINNPDGSMSFKIVDIEPGGIFAHLGIQNEDVITHINGTKINNLNEVMGLFSKISTLDKLNITLKRGNEEVPLDYKMK